MKLFGTPLLIEFFIAARTFLARAFVFGLFPVDVLVSGVLVFLVPDSLTNE